MSVRRAVLVGGMVAVFGSGYALGSADGPHLVAAASASTLPVQATQVYELRTYTAPAGKLDALLTRFRDHTMRIFEKHGMTNVGYWLPQDTALRQNTLVYLLAHPSREAADQSWRAFAADPEWQRVSEESQRDGRIVERVVRQWLDPTDFSPMQ